jgi:DNA modification methylase
MVRPFFERVLVMAHECLPKFGHAYVFCDWRSWASWWETAKFARMTPKNMLVWDKGPGGLGSNYTLSHELIGFFHKLPPSTALRQSGEKGQRNVNGASNILRWPRVSGEERLHNAAKPVGLLKELIENSSEKGQTVVDFFCGSGSTMIACEHLERVCHTSEIDPETAQIAVTRWERLTGDKAKLVS